MRGGTSGSLARLQTCMYVCLSSRPTLSMYVCTSDRPKQVCMYVCLRLLSKYVCMSQATERVCMLCAERVCMFQVCMYVSESEDLCMYGCLRHTYIVKRVEHVCLVC